MTRLSGLWFLVLTALTVVVAAGTVQPGIDVLQSRAFRELRGKRVGLIANPASVNREGRSTIDILHRAVGLEIGALFGPEHGVEGKHDAGVEFPDGVHVPTGLPMYSLYGPGAVRAPTAAMLKNLDALVYDVQDTGVRNYTYISTMGLAMEACGAAGVEFVVLDRPNPLGGLRIEGPMLDPKFKSFVGQWPIPLLYGLTPGELARMIAGEKWIATPPKLTIVRMQGWNRTMTWQDTGLDWRATSPGVPSAERCFYLPAMSLLADIGGVSVGFGTSMPYECLAAPWFNANQLCDWLQGRGLPGVRFLPVKFTPTRGAYAGQEVQGARIRFTDLARAPLVSLNFYAFEAARRLGGRDLYASAAKHRTSFSFFDKINGTDQTRAALKAGKSAAEIIASWAAGEESFRRKRARYLLYP
ncbi:MAG: DUF1343 domain-containing protein [Verrucomicrobiales bacterium]|nr:DUF1343 domain-containing protein [Verrucomicrobiales bacterium]